jgi:hypothetical protein
MLGGEEEFDWCPDLRLVRAGSSIPCIGTDYALVRGWPLVGSTAEIHITYLLRVVTDNTLR